MAQSALIAPSLSLFHDTWQWYVQLSFFVLTVSAQCTTDVMRLLDLLAIRPQFDVIVLQLIVTVTQLKQFSQSLRHLYTFLHFRCLCEYLWRFNNFSCFDFKATFFFLNAVYGSF